MTVNNLISDRSHQDFLAVENVGAPDKTVIMSNYTRVAGHDVLAPVYARLDWSRSGPFDIACDLRVTVRDGFGRRQF